MTTPAWHCFLQSVDGTVLMTVEHWPDAASAALIGERVLRAPEQFALVDPDDRPVDLARLQIDVDAGVTAELAA